MNIMDKNGYNPLLKNFNTRYESAPFDDIRTEHFAPAIDQLILESEEHIQNIASEKSDDSKILLLPSKRPVKD
jgi:Zn-dependent oligopeptidase